MVRRLFMLYLISCIVVSFYDHDCYVNVLSYDAVMNDGYCAYWFTISNLITVEFHYIFSAYVIKSSQLIFIIYIVVLTLLLSNTSSRRRIVDKYRGLSHIL